jgi:hypothetical protein
MIVSRCTAAGCNVLTMGPLCVQHDVPVTCSFVRGRPFAPNVAASAEVAPAVVVPLPVPASAPAATAGLTHLVRAS